MMEDLQAKLHHRPSFYHGWPNLLSWDLMYSFNLTDKRQYTENQPHQPFHHYSLAVPSTKKSAIALCTRRVYTICSTNHLKPRLEFLKQTFHGLLNANGYTSGHINLIVESSKQCLRRMKKPSVKLYPSNIFLLFPAGQSKNINIADVSGKWHRTINFSTSGVARGVIGVVCPRRWQKFAYTRKFGKGKRCFGWVEVFRRQKNSKVGGGWQNYSGGDIGKNPGMGEKSNQGFKKGRQKFFVGKNVGGLGGRFKVRPGQQAP